MARYFLVAVDAAYGCANDLIGSHSVPFVVQLDPLHEGVAKGAGARPDLPGHPGCNTVKLSLETLEAFRNGDVRISL
jgi:hypothetical protein